MANPARKPEDASALEREMAALAEGARPQLKALIAAFAVSPRLTEDEARASLIEAGFKEDRFMHLLYDARRHLRRQGWYIFRISARNERGYFQLAPDEDPPPMAREVPSAGGLHAKPVPVERTAPPVAARVLAVRRPPRIKAAPGGCCQFIIVREGKPSACGKPSKGTYCPEHKAKAAGVPYIEGLY